MKKPLFVLAVLLCWLGLPAAGRATDAAIAADAGATENTLVICGSGDSQTLLRRLAAAYEKLQPDMTVEVPDSIGSNGGIKATAAGKCDLGRVSRPLKETEQQLNLSYLLFARSPVVFLVNASVREVKSITAAQAAAIFSGAITDWSELGGRHAKIYVANREKGDSSLTVIENAIPAFRDIKKQTGQTLYTTPENIETINRYRDTIGYAPLAEAADQPGILVLQLDNVAANRKNVMDGTYKLTIPFGLVWINDPAPKVRKFIDFIASPAAARIMAEHGTFSTLPGPGGNDR
jgi:phosphate transport system substrate-binding protein